MNIEILFLDNELTGFEEFFDKNQFEEYCETHSFTGKQNQILSVPPSFSKDQNPTFLVGTGENKDDINLYDIGILIGSKIESDAEINFLNINDNTNLMIDGILYAQYKFNDYKSEDSSSINNISFKNIESTENEIKKDSVYWVRDLINTPALDKSPEAFIDKVNVLVDSSTVDVQVYDKKWLEENNFGGVLGVGKGSDRPPYFLVGKYNAKAKYQVSLIGKGVLFDTGGYSLKSPAGMELSLIHI